MVVAASQMVHRQRRPLLLPSHRGFYLGRCRSCWALRAWVHCLCWDRKDRAGPEALESSHTPRCSCRDEDCERQNVSSLSGKLNCADTAVKFRPVQHQHCRCMDLKMDLKVYNTKNNECVSKKSGHIKYEKKHIYPSTFFLFMYFFMDSGLPEFRIQCGSV